MKKLCDMAGGDSGKIMKIRGKADIHRRLLRLGITIGRIVQVINTKAGPEYALVKVRINKRVHLLDRAVASGIKLDTNC